MKNNIFYTKLCEKSHFGKDTVEKALSFSQNIDTNTLSRLLFDSQKPKVLENNALFYKGGFYPYEFFDFARKEIKKHCLPDETGFLYIYIALAEASFVFFKEHGFSDDIFFDTFEGISRTCDFYKKELGVDGIYDYIWLSGHLCANVLRLGCFEYQNGVFSFDDTVEISGKAVNKGDMTVFLHVPYQTNLSLKSRHCSYKKAYSFFGPQVLVCDSWLLHPANTENLSEKSNICSFAKDFDIFHVDNNFCPEDLYRIFGIKENFRNTDKLPRDTQLQRLYAERLKKGLPLGSACGIRLLTEKL